MVSYDQTDQYGLVLRFPKVVNLSLPKTGSTTIYEAFLNSSSSHEGFHVSTVDKIIDYYEGRLSSEQLKIFLLRRQRLLKTQLDSSTFMHLIAGEIQELYPATTTYICIIRHPCEWARSYLSMLYEVGRYLTATQNGHDLRWTIRYAEFQARSLNPILLFQESSNTEMLLTAIEELCIYWRKSIFRVHESIDASSLISAPIEDIATVIQAVGRLLDKEPCSLPHANKNAAPQATQDAIQRACEIAALESDTVRDAINDYHQYAQC